MDQFSHSFFRIRPIIIYIAVVDYGISLLVFGLGSSNYYKKKTKKEGRALCGEAIVKKR